MMDVGMVWGGGVVGKGLEGWEKAESAVDLLFILFRSECYRSKE